MCDYGRLNYKWINRADRLTEVRGSQLKVQLATGLAQALIREVADVLKKAPSGSVAIVASARQTNEELYLLKKIAARCNAMTDSVARVG